MEKNKELQQKYLELKSLEQQINNNQQQISILNKQINEFKNLSDNLVKIKQTKKDTEMFSPLGAGIFLKAELKDSQNVIMNVGSNTFVLKTVDEASDLIKKQIEELGGIIHQLELNFQELIMHAQKLEQEIITLTAKNK